MFTIEPIQYGSVLKSEHVSFSSYPDFTHASVSLHNSPLEIYFEFLVSELKFGQRTIGEEIFHTVSFISSQASCSDAFTFTFDNDQELEQFCSFYGLKLPTNSLCTLCMNNFTSQTVCKECDSALKLAVKPFANKLAQSLRS
ncbi:conserved hypothetical protein [Vibrio chagasii]|nr:conserved hypothetical protein [Vibrio chagasii]CAH7372579.1 conserved hypothetical protein [Vibrio chagasii]